MIEILKPLIENALKRRLTAEEIEIYEKLKDYSMEGWENLDPDEQRKILVKRDAFRDLLGDFVLGFFRAPRTDYSLPELPVIYDHPSKVTSLFLHRFKYVYDEGDYWQTPEETWHRRTPKPIEGKDIDIISPKKGKLLKYKYTLDDLIAGKKDTLFGDCDDYARFATWVLGKAGYRTQVMTMFGDGSGHATCLIDMGDEYWTVGTFYRIQHRTKDVIKVAEFFYDDVRKVRLYNQDLKTFKLTETGGIKVE